MSAVQQHPPAHLLPEEEEQTQDSQTTSTDDANTNKYGSNVHPLALPAIPTDEEEARKLDLSRQGGSTAKLDHLGPMVVNSDGTISRIHNWSTMTDAERRRTEVVLGKRNKSRLAALEKAEKAEQEREGGEQRGE